MRESSTCSVRSDEFLDSPTLRPLVMLPISSATPATCSCFPNLMAKVPSSLWVKDETFAGRFLALLHVKKGRDFAATVTEQRTPCLE